MGSPLSSWWFSLYVLLSLPRLLKQGVTCADFGACLLLKSWYCIVPLYFLKGIFILKKLKWLIYTRPFIGFVYYFIQLYSLTLRFRVENEQKWQHLLRQGTPILLCGWHQQFFSAIRYFKTYSKFNPGLMISQSKDGDLISGVANRTGWHTPRGSSSRGGNRLWMPWLSI